MVQSEQNCINNHLPSDQGTGSVQLEIFHDQISAFQGAQDRIITPFIG